VPPWRVKHVMTLLSNGTAPSVRIAGCQQTSGGAPSTALALADNDGWLCHLVRLELYLKIAIACKELLHVLL
jgi:hypothetical protein